MGTTHSEKTKTNCPKEKKIILTYRRKSKILLKIKMFVYVTTMRRIRMYNIDCRVALSNPSLQLCRDVSLNSSTSFDEAGASWYLSNHTLHTVLHIKNVRKVIQDKIAKYNPAICMSSKSTYGKPLLEPDTTQDWNERGQLTWNIRL